MYQKRDYYDRLGRRQFTAKEAPHGRTEYRDYFNHLLGYSTVDSYGRRNYYDRLGHKLGYRK